MSDGHVVLPGSHRPAKQGAVRVGDVDPGSPVEVTVTLRGPELPQLDTGKSGIPRSDFAARYGAGAADIAKVRDTLERLGLVVEEASSAGRSLRVSGTAAAMEEAFHPGLGVYRSPDQGEFRGRDGDLEIPADLDGLVTGVFGFDERRMVRRARSAEAVAKAGAAAGAALSIADLEQRYNFPPGDGNGRQVGIAEFGGGYLPDDLEAFCKQQGVAEAQVTVVDVGLKPPTPRRVEELPEARQNEFWGDSTEVMMDIEIVAGLCPAAEIFVYFAKFTQKGWIDLLNKLIGGDAAELNLLSVSWGLAEDSEGWSSAARNEINLRLQAAAQLGVTVCAASGDDGSGDDVEDGHFHVNFPASSPNVLSVGGTMLDGAQEVVWWQAPGQRFLPGGGEPSGGGATGGGVSVIFARPSWQDDVDVKSKNAGAIEGRVMPDVVALAGLPYYQLVFQGKSAPNGGTSAATPLWAALLTRIAATGKPTQQPTFLAPLLYENGPAGRPRGEEGCVDITTGNNASNPKPGVGYEATKGYDAVSGWGVPDGVKLAASLP
jgi:kumamolisin